MMKKNAIIFILILILSILSVACSGVIDRLDLPEPSDIQPTETLVNKPSDTPIPPSALPSDEPTPTPTPSTAPVPETFTLLAAGDVMAHSDNLRAAYDSESGLYDFSENYIHVSPLISNADFSLVNLETVTAGPESGYTSYPLFNTPAAIVDALSEAGFTALVTANNHTLDRGKEGIYKTLQEIDRTGLLHTGTYTDEGLNYLEYDFRGYNISILAYTQHLNGNEPLLDESDKYMVNVMNLEKISDDIRTAAEDSSLVVVYLHWGNEYTRSEEDWQRSYAVSLFEAGADVILGTHPHVIRPAETMIVDGEIKYVIYSMGNFISNFIRTDRRENAIYTEDGVMVQLTFDIDESGNFSLSNARHIPTWPYKYEDNKGLHYEIIPIVNPDERLHENDYADSEARKSYERTMETLGSFSIR